MVEVLVVEDAADIRLLVRAVLTRFGCQVLEAASAAEALAVLESAVPDVVLLDVQMPDADGWSVLETIRRDPHIATVPVVLCTVKGHPSDRVRGWQLGCDGYLIKPFAIRDLVDEVMAVAERSPQQRQQVRDRALAELSAVGGVER